MSPASGTYDPSLGTMARLPTGELIGSGGLAGQSQRGYDYLGGDVSDMNARDARELGFTVQGLERQKGRTLADLLDAKTRWDKDFGRDYGREGEDYGRATTDLGTQYQRLASSQAGNAVQAGVASGGTFAAALAARTANQQHDQSGLDLQHTRFQTDAQEALARSNADYVRSQTRVGEDYGEDDLGAVGAARRQAGYGISDRLKQLGQAGVENQFYQADLGDQRWYQASQAGYAPPAKGQPGGQPANEFTDPATGANFRVVVRGSRRYRVNPDGSEKFVGTRPKAKK